MASPKAGQTPLASSSFFGNVAKSYGGLRLEEVTGTDGAVNKLKKYSITTVEELVAISRVRPRLIQETAGFIYSETLARDMNGLTLKSHELLQRYPTFENFEYRFGAILKDAPRAAQPSPTHVRESITGYNGNEVLLINDCMPPIRDQGERYTCVAFATCAVVEYAFCKSKDLKLDLSEQFQYWNCKRNDRHPNDKGTYPDVSFALARRDGICKETMWLYVSSENSSNPTYDPPPIGAIIEAASFKVAQATSMASYRSVDELEKKVRNGFPVAIAIPVYNSWELSANTRITGNITLPLPGEQPTAGHALVIVGYAHDDDFAGGGYFVVRNSWGTTQWGVDCPCGKGYGTLPY